MTITPALTKFGLECTCEISTSSGHLSCSMAVETLLCSLKFRPLHTVILYRCIAFMICRDARHLHSTERNPRIAAEQPMRCCCATDATIQTDVVFNRIRPLPGVYCWLACVLHGTLQVIHWNLRSIVRLSMHPEHPTRTWLVWIRQEAGNYLQSLIDNIISLDADVRDLKWACMSSIPRKRNLFQLFFLNGKDHRTCGIVPASHVPPLPKYSNRKTHVFPSDDIGEGGGLEHGEASTNRCGTKCNG